MNQRRNIKGILIILFSLLICVPITFTIATINIMALTNEVETNDNETTIELEKEYIPSEQISISVCVDIKPGSWPNPINLKSKGVLPVAICGTEEFDVTTIDPSSIVLRIEDSEEEVSPLRWSLEDVATPYTEDDGGGHELTDDGYLDLLLHFDTQEVVITLILTYYIGETIPLIIKGNILEEYGGTPIIGQDYIRILGEALEPIFIDDEGGGDFTWKEASKQWWCKGAATEEDPYIIENIKINGAGTLYCIRVYNSDAYFIIKNCILYGIDVIEPSGAIVLLNTENGEIIDNFCIDNGHPMYTVTSGISILDSDNNKVQGNDCTGNTGVGIYVGSSNNNDIMDNVCGDTLYGILITGISEFTLGDKSEQNWVLNNNCTNCEENGILLVNTSYNNYIEDNFLQDNRFGIAIGNGASYNEVSENEVIENWQIGIVLFIGETDPFEPAWFNEIYHNNIIDNALQAWDANSMNNYWYENYWSDYPGEDTDDDGIGETLIPWPFLWPGYDYSPYMEKNGWE